MKKIRNTLYNILRPFYAPINRVLRKKLVSPHAFLRHPEMALPMPWDFIQMQVERRLHEYLHCQPSEVQKVVVVGANIGGEIDSLSKTYPYASFVCFEPSPKYFSELQRKYKESSRVDCRKVACGENAGLTTFYELPMDGNGSLLKPDVEAWKHQNNWSDSTIEEFEVEVSTLDIQIKGDDPIDVLWVDVQGAERQVLLGGRSVLSRTRAVFLEVAIAKNSYEGGTLIDDLSQLLKPSGHALVGLGTDPWSFTGNALWIRSPESLFCTR